MLTGAAGNEAFSGHGANYFINYGKFLLKMSRNRMILRKNGCAL